MKTSSKILLSLAALSGFTRAVFACDSCALYVADDTGQPGFTLSVAHQFTRLGTVWQGDHRLGNPVNQYLDSSITQVSVGYTPGGRWQLQLTLPYINRAYLRPDHALVEKGREQGIGDATAAARYRLWQTTTNAGNKFEFNLLGGLKFSTGNADHLGDEIGHHFHHHAGFPDSGIHGHDLALGSGSTDGLLGTDAEWKCGRFFTRGQIQYKLRQSGAFDYRLADETSWEVAAGAFAVQSGEYSLAVSALYSAEHKGCDTLAGIVQADTGISVRFLGARVTGTWGKHLEAGAAVEVPVWLRTTETMVVPDYRVRTALNWRF